MKVFVIAFLLLILTAANVQASGFNIQSIGGVNVAGRQYSNFWHTSLNPEIIGECLPTIAVDVTLDGVASTVPCSSDGSWTYNMPAQTEGVHKLTFTNSGSTLAMDLTLGSSATEHYDGGVVDETLPSVGMGEVTLGMLMIAVGFFVTGRKILSRV